MTTLVCWRCGATLTTIHLPLERLAQCRQCSADLHVCRQCQYYNPKLNDNCNQDMAEPARQLDTANFCDYFQASANAYQAIDNSRADAAMAQLNALFSDAIDTPQGQSGQDIKTDMESDKARFDALFKPD